MYPKTLLTTLAFVLNSLVFTSFGNAQPWTVGVPVNTFLTSIGGFTGGCYPNADFTFSFPGTNVSGVNYYLIVNTAPAGSILLQPVNDTIAVGDTIPFSIGNNTFEVYCFSGGCGQVVFDIIAMGTPTTAGQPYPCTVSQIWLNNMMLCPSGYFNNPSNNCQVQAGSSGISELEQNGIHLVLPTAGNGWTMEIGGKLTAFNVQHVSGNTVYSSDRSDVQSIDMTAFAAGVYNITILQGSRQYSQKFVLIR